MTWSEFKRQVGEIVWENTSCDPDWDEAWEMWAGNYTVEEASADLIHEIEWNS